MINNRQNPRALIDVNSLLYLDNQQIYCKTKDISKTGISFILPNFICPTLETPIDFQLLIPGKSKTNKGRIVRIIQDRINTILGCEVIQWAE